jgi:hypothetical protein
VSTFGGVGRSELRDPLLAGREAGQQARRALDGRTPQFALAFATTGHDQAAVLAGLREALPGAKLAGCSGEGIIAGAVSDEGERAVAVLALSSATLQFETFAVRDYSAGPRAAGETLARAVNAVGADDAIALLVFLDGLLGDATELLQGIESTLATPMPIVGGAAGDAQAFVRTFQYEGGEVLSDAVSAALIRGRGRMDFALSHGCRPIGLERRITRAEGPWVHEIDGRPAWSVFRQYLEGEPEDLNTEGIVHLSVGEDLPPEQAKGYEPFIIHTPLALDRETGALFFPGGGIRNGSAIRVTRRDPERIGASAKACAERIRDQHAGRTPAFVLQFDCAGRGKQFFASRTAELIVHPLQRVLGTETPWIGFHTYGEIAPIGGVTRYHNFTVALCAVYDDA